VNSNRETNTEILSNINNFVLFKIFSSFAIKCCVRSVKFLCPNVNVIKQILFHYTLLIDFIVFRTQYMQRNSKTKFGSVQMLDLLHYVK